MVLSESWAMANEIETARVAVLATGLGPVVRVVPLHGNGNVIAVVELTGAHDDPLPLLRAATLAACGAVTSVRVDGVLFFYPGHRRGLRMIFFDRDGTWEALCGNGLRCVTRYAADRGLLTGDGVIVTDDGDKPVRADAGQVRVVLGAARQLRRLADDRWFVYTGVAHLVLFLPDDAALAALDVVAEGSRLRYDTELCTRLGHPGGVHVDFAVVGPDGIALRTYEVGVEDETQCCGTGAAAAAAVAAASGRAGLPVAVHTLGGVLEVGEQAAGLSLAGAVGYLTGRHAEVLSQ